MKYKIIGLLYRYLCKPIFFQIDPEKTHELISRFGIILGKSVITRRIVKFFFYYSNPILEQNLYGINFKNPVGLAAGFDKNAELTNILPSVGFGFVEVGSITGQECKGNPKPRLWRLKKSKSLIVNYGLKNKGSEKISSKLKLKKFSVPVGISIAKTNSKDFITLNNGIEDYLKSVKLFKEIADYITINISCPNAFGGESFTDPYNLDKLLYRISFENIDIPIFIKLTSGLSEKELDKIVDVAQKYKIAGYVCSNLCKNRDNINILEKNIFVKGGISGKPTEEDSNKQIKYIYKKTNGKKIIIGCGGIFSAEDAYKKIIQGASLVQLITGMIFEGPQLIGDINFGLAKILKDNGFNNIKEAVGTANR